MMNSTKETMIMITWTLGNAPEQFFSPLEGRFELSVVIKFELMASTWIIRKKLSMMHCSYCFTLKSFVFDWIVEVFCILPIVLGRITMQVQQNWACCHLDIEKNWLNYLLGICNHWIQLSSWLLVFPCNIYFRKHNNGVVILWLLTWKTLFSFFNFCTPM